MKKASGEYDCEVVLRLNLEGLGLTSIGNLASCTILRDLFLAKNEISDVNPLKVLSESLERLDLSFNKISSIDALESLQKLTWLDVKGNQLGSFDSISCLSSMQKLQSLFLQTVDSTYQNGVCKLTSYSSRIMQLNPNLIILDGHHVDLLTATMNVEEAIANVRSDAEAAKDIPIEPWFTTEDVDIPEEFSLPSADEVISKIGSALKSDCSRLLQKAQSAMQKADGKV